MNNIFSTIVKRAVRLAGSKAKTDRGRAMAILKSPLAWKLAIKESNRKPMKISNVLDRLTIGSDIELWDNTIYGGYWFEARSDSDALARARNELGKCGHRSNYGDGDARVYGHAVQCREEPIHYKKWRDGSYAYRDYQSCVGISKSGKSAVVIVSCVLKRRIIAPKDLRFDHDDTGIFCRRLTDNMDFHPESKDWLRKDFWTNVRKQMALNYTKRLSNRKIEQEGNRLKSIMDKQMASAYVLLEDSRRAGNCVAGSLAFAERRLGLTSDEILAAPFLVKVQANRLLSTNEPRARAAVIQAWKRETIVAI